MPDINEYVLGNGLRVITVRKDSAIMALNLGFAMGAMMDPPGKKGLAHFLEHMLFTGTQSRDHVQLNADFEFLGGDVNAFTDLTQLVISVAALDNELQRALELVSDIARHPAFKASELERERQVILSEYKEGLEDLETTAFDLLYQKAWPEDPLLLDVIGNSQSISAIALSDLSQHHSRWIRPDNAVLTVVSCRSHQEMKVLVEDWFHDWQRGDFSPGQLSAQPNTPGIWQTTTDNSDMATVCLVYSFPGLSEADQTGLKVLNRRLGDSDNSLLFREVRLKRGLSYDIYSNLDLTPSVRTLEIYCATDAEHVSEVTAIIQGITQDITSGAIRFTDKDLELTRKMQRTNVAGLMDDTLGLCSYITANALDGLPLLHYEQELAEMEKVTVDDLTRLARLVFINPTVSMLIPAEEEDSED